MWTRPGTVAGDINSNACTYDVIVPANSPFTLIVSSNFQEPAPACGNTVVEAVGNTQHITVVKDPVTHILEVTKAWWQTCPR